jgi:hypothetical protein
LEVEKKAKAKAEKDDAVSAGLWRFFKLVLCAIIVTKYGQMVIEGVL